MNSNVNKELTALPENALDLQTKKTFTADVVERDGELYLVFPEGAAESLGWQVGDELEWSEGEAHQYVLKKMSK